MRRFAPIDTLILAKLQVPLRCSTEKPVNYRASGAGQRGSVAQRTVDLFSGDSPRTTRAC